jgi:hypothetical protein
MSIKLAFRALALALLTMGATANAEPPLLLTCEGQMRAVSRNVSEPSSLALAIDLDVGKVRIGSWGSTPITNKEGTL